VLVSPPEEEEYERAKMMGLIAGNAYVKPSVPLSSPSASASSPSSYPDLYGGAAVVRVGVGVGKKRDRSRSLSGERDDEGGPGGSGSGWKGKKPVYGASSYSTLGDDGEREDDGLNEGREVEVEVETEVDSRAMVEDWPEFVFSLTLFLSSWSSCAY
jgi:hypothetical protein